MREGWSNWAHLMCSTRGAWIPGDERGFRAAHHKIHSSGDYTNPPPRDEHSGLRAHSMTISRNTVVLPAEIRTDVASAFAEKFTSLGCRPWIVAVAATHVHTLVGVGRADAKRVMAKAKQFASHRVRDRTPGRLWGQLCHVVRIRDERHFRSVEAYIEQHGVAESAAIWRHPDLRVHSGQASVETMISDD